MGLPVFKYSKEKSKITNDIGTERDFYLDTTEHELYVRGEGTDNNKYLLNNTNLTATASGGTTQSAYATDNKNHISENQVVFGKITQKDQNARFIVGDGTNEAFAVRTADIDGNADSNELVFGSKSLFTQNAKGELSVGNALKAYIRDLIYPVGSIYISLPPEGLSHMTLQDKYNPNILWGGKWELISKGTYLRAGDYAEEFPSDNSFNVGGGGGRNSKKIQLENLPDHAHKLAAWGVGVASMETTGDPEVAAFYIATQRSPMWKTIINSQLTTTNAVGQITSEHRNADHPSAVTGEGEYLVKTTFESDEGEPLNGVAFNVEPQYINVAMWRRIN